ncbi:MAG: hypothetical protein LBO78_01555 [Rickettsiales bacterium]|nr:hypothetical protein [Rickettsiales bacterium]
MEKFMHHLAKIKHPHRDKDGNFDPKTQILFDTANASLELNIAHICDLLSTKRFARSVKRNLSETLEHYTRLHNAINSADIDLVELYGDMAEAVSMLRDTINGSYNVSKGKLWSYVKYRHILLLVRQVCNDQVGFVPPAISTIVDNYPNIGKTGESELKQLGEHFIKENRRINKEYEVFLRPSLINRIQLFLHERHEL